MRQSVFAGELLIREVPLPENDPSLYVRSLKSEMIDEVIADALAEEGFGELVIDSVEWRESIPSERMKTPFHVTQHEVVPSELVDGRQNIYEFSVDSADVQLFIFAVNGIQKKPYRFRVFDEGWVLEAKGMQTPVDSAYSPQTEYAVVVNGQLLNVSLSLDDCWGYRHVGGEPFFFFRRGDEFGWYYCGDETVSDYEIVEHNRCCKDIQMNPHFFYNAVSFFAARDDQWYQVVGMIPPSDK